MDGEFNDDLNNCFTEIEARMKALRPILNSAVPCGDKWLSFMKHDGKWRLVYNEKPVAECTVIVKVKIANDIPCLKALIAKIKASKTEVMKEVAQAAETLRQFLKSGEL